MTGVPVPAVPIALPVERVLWSLRKGERMAEAIVRDYPHGCELRFVADGVLRWSRLYRIKGDELTQTAAVKRHDFERLGWHTAE